MARLLLEIFKYLSIIIGSLSGFIATYADTRDKATDKPNRAGKILILIIFLSFFVSIISQAIETKLQNDEANADRAQQDSLLQSARMSISELTELNTLDSVILRNTVKDLSEFHAAPASDLDAIRRRIDTATIFLPRMRFPIQIEKQQGH